MGAPFGAIYCDGEIGITSATLPCSSLSDNMAIAQEDSISGDVIVALYFYLYAREGVLTMQHLTAEEAKDQLPDLMQAAMKGAEVVIRDNGCAVKLVPVPEEPQEPPRKRRKAGSAKGIILYMADDFDAPLDDFKEYM